VKLGTPRSSYASTEDVDDAQRLDSRIWTCHRREINSKIHLRSKRKDEKRATAFTVCYIAGVPWRQVLSSLPTQFSESSLTSQAFEMAATTRSQRRIFSLDGPPTILEVERTPTTNDVPLNPPILSPLTAAHRSQSEKTLVVLRSEDDYSYSTPATAVNSRAPSPVKELDDLESDQEAKPIDRLLLWRLASGFFAYFVGGWADGGKASIMSCSYIY